MYFAYDSLYIYTYFIENATPSKQRCVIRRNRHTGCIISRPIFAFGQLEHFGMILGENCLTKLAPPHNLVIITFREIGLAIQTYNDFCAGRTPLFYCKDPYLDTEIVLARVQTTLNEELEKYSHNHYDILRLNCHSFLMKHVHGTKLKNNVIVYILLFLLSILLLH